MNKSKYFGRIFADFFRANSEYILNALTGKRQAGATIGMQTILVNHSRQPAGNFLEAVESFLLGQLRYFSLFYFSL